MELGLILALLFMIFAFTAFKRFEAPRHTKQVKMPTFDAIEIPKTIQQQQTKPPSRPSIPIPSESEEIPEDATIEITELDFGALPAPPEPPEDDDSEIPMFWAFEKAPTIIGGYAALARKLEYPEMARRAGIGGIVIVKALIGLKGEIIKTEILKSLGNNGCDEAAVKAIRAVKWTPAYQRDKPVKVWFAIRILFKLNE